MKCLAESLFDKDLVQKSADLTIRDAYGFFGNKRSDCYLDTGKEFFGTLFLHHEIENYDHPITNDDCSKSDFFSEWGCKLLGILMDLPLPPSSVNDKKWCQSLKDAYAPYVRPYYKDIWEKMIVNYTYYLNRKKLLISIHSREERYPGIYCLELTLTRK